MADKDFRENAPLDAARDEQAHIEMRIRDLEEKLRNAVIIDEQAKGGRANVGSFVRLLNLSTSKEQQFTLVSPAEVDPKNGKISIQSPVGIAVQNRSEGDEVTVNAPSGPIPFRIVEVRG
jgi:transcription elongation factor GreA